ncbi:hypothetical protein CEE45_00780 [Candidatus Heimdallarchaeota archaeon B3_Heim]|nr:MAG: hypothetical protein CEE45_00780 [Candidatus Heimdallarchaeota archaeon B3_Heim]
MAKKENEDLFTLLITTSHNPSHFLRRVSKLLSFSLPLSKRMNRGSLSLKEIKNLCWNMGINKLLIVHGSKKIDSISLSCYDFIQSPKQFEVNAKLENFNFPRKGEKETRVDCNYISVEYPLDIPISLKERIQNFLNPLLSQTKSKQTKSTLKIKFSDYSNGNLHGEVVRTVPNNGTPLYSFVINIMQEVE